MKIGFDARLFRKGLGLGRYVEQLLVQYDQMDLGDHELVVFLSKEGMDGFIPTNPRIRTVVAPYHWYSWSEQFKFPKLLAQYNLDVVHFPHFNVPIWYTRKYVVTIHDLILLKMPRSARIAATTRMSFVYDIKYLVYKYVLKTALRNSSHIITPTEYVKQDLIKMLNVSASKITRIYEAAMKHPVAEPASRTVEGPYILYIGNAYPHKNIDVLIRLAKQYKETGSDMKIILAGQDDHFSQQLRQRIATEQLQEVIVHKGFIADEQLSSLYAGATCYVFPSREEGFGLPGLEAMSYSTPVVASDSSCLKEVYGDAALYASPDDEGAWLEAIEKIRYDSVLRQGLIDAGTQRVSQFDWGRAAHETLQLLLSV